LTAPIAVTKTASATIISVIRFFMKTQPPTSSGSRLAAGKAERGVFRPTITNTK
jgi:hypothetical protein